MTSHIHGFLRDVGKNLHLGANEESAILDELKTHIEDHTQDLIESGVASDKAVDCAVDSLGGTDGIARQLYEVHSRGSWYHTALATLPHILLALMFVFHLWATPGWVISLLVVAMLITIFGWRKGRPRWTYPWLGYCLVIPLVSWALAMSAVGYGAWGIVTQGALPLGAPIYIASFVYIAFSLWIVIRIVSRVARPDWVMASLAVLPVPFLAFWFFYFYNGGDLFQPDAKPLHAVDNSAAVVFLIVAAATAIFFRIGRRLVRVALLAITAPSMIILAWVSYQGGSGTMAVFVFCAVSLAVLLSPALFDLKENRSAPYHYQPVEERHESLAD
jgi:hypothetical protein